MKTHVACAAALLCVLAPGVRAQQIAVRVNGDPVSFEGIGPRQVNGRVLVPLRGVLEQMGAYVGWDAATQTVNASRGGLDLRLPIGSRTAWVNGRAVTLDVPATTIAGTTMVPLRFMSEALGANVSWNDASRSVAITTAGTARSAGYRAGRRGFAHRSRAGAHTPRVYSVTSDLNGSDVDPGQTVNVRMRATPGGRGFFRIRYVVGEKPMDEVSPGVYEGSWTNTGNHEVTVNSHDILAFVLIGSIASAEIRPRGSTGQ